MRVVVRQGFYCNIKMPQISELREFCSEYQNPANLPKTICQKLKTLQSLKNATNFKLTQNVKCRKYQSAMNVPFYSYFFHTFSFCFRTFILVFTICSPIFFLLLFHVTATVSAAVNSCGALCYSCSCCSAITSTSATRPQLRATAVPASTSRQRKWQRTLPGRRRLNQRR